MKKTLITKDNLDDFTCRVSSRIYIDPRAMLLTPGAKDKLAQKGFSVMYGPCPDAESCKAHAYDAPGQKHDDSEQERLFYGVAAVLKNEYGITDLEQLQALSTKAVAVIRANI